MSDKNHKYLYIKNKKEKEIAIMGEYDKKILPSNIVMNSIYDYNNTIIKNNKLYIHPVPYNELNSLNEDTQLVTLKRFDYYCPNYNDIFYKTIRHFGTNIRQTDNDEITVDCRQQPFIKSYLPKFENIILLYANKIRIPENFKNIHIINSHNIDLELNKINYGQIIIEYSSINNIKTNISNDYKLQYVTLEDDIELNVKTNVELQDIKFNGHKIKITSSEKHYIDEIRLRNVDISQIEFDPNIIISTLKIFDLKSSNPIIFPKSYYIYVDRAKETNKIVIDLLQQYDKGLSFSINNINVPIIFNKIQAIKSDDITIGKFRYCPNVQIEDIIIDPETMNCLIKFDDRSNDSTIIIKKIEFTSQVNLLKIKPVKSNTIIYKDKEITRLTSFKRKI